MDDPTTGQQVQTGNIALLFTSAIITLSTGGALRERCRRGKEGCQQQSARSQRRYIRRSRTLVQVGPTSMTSLDRLMFTPCVSSDVMETPLRAIPESKKSFLPSLSEKQKVLQHNQPIISSQALFPFLVFDITSSILHSCKLRWGRWCTRSRWGG